MFAALMQSPPLREGLLAAARRRAALFRSRDGVAEQRALFRHLLRSAACTRFGRDYGFSRLAGLPFEQAYACYRERVPIRSYADFWEDYLGAHLSLSPCGEPGLDLRNTTWPGRIGLFCETSGTTAPTKHIPFSREMFAANRRAALDLLSCYLAANPRSRLPRGKLLYMAGSTCLKPMGKGVYAGDMSAITFRFRPWYLSPFVEPSSGVSAMEWDDRLQAMAELLLTDRRIHAVSGVPPWILLLLRRCRDLSGRELAEALPHLELVIHGGTAIGPYRAEFEELFQGRLPELLEVLPSSEAFMGFQCAGEEGMRLTPFYGAFFEFVRFEDLDSRGCPPPHGMAVPLERVEIGQRYAVILSTCAGLWRYHIGDTIRFTSLSPYRIQFTGRDRFLDKLEEKVTQEEVELVVAALNREGLCAVREFMVGTDVPGRRHVWFLAGTLPPGAEFLSSLVDRNLRQLNADYAAFREQGRIAAPRVIPLPGDMIYDWSRVERDRLGGQSKIPHIDPTPEGSLTASLMAFRRSRPPVPKDMAVANAP